MHEQDDVQAESERILREASELIRLGEKTLKENEEYLGRPEGASGDADRQFDWSKLPPKVREKAQNELEAFKQELDRIKSEAKEKMREKLGRKAPKPSARRNKMWI